MSGAMSRDNNLQTSLLPTTEVSAFVAKKNALILGCATCNSNKGVVYVFNPTTMRKVKEISGTNQYQYLGLQVLPARNAGTSSQFWFTSRSSSSYINMHAVVVFSDYDTGTVYAEEKWDLYGYSASSTSDYASASLYLESIFYKSILGSEIGTFESCQYNQQFSSDFSLEGRACDACSKSKAVSYGFSETQCESCNDVASYVDNSSAIVRFLFLTACPPDVEKTVGEDGKIKDEEELINPDPVVPDSNTDTDTTDNTSTDEKQEE